MYFNQKNDTLYSQKLQERDGCVSILCPYIMRSYFIAENLFLFDSF